MDAPSEEAEKNPLQLQSHGRFPYIGIVERPHGTWAQGRRLAVYVAVNLEHFTFGSGLGAQLVPAAAGAPDVLNWAWREWGNRVGAWRLLSLLDDLNLPVAALANAALVEHAPQLLRAYAAHRPGCEMVGHGISNSERQGDAWAPSDEAAMLQTCATALAPFSPSGARPKGWLSPWIAESKATVDLLAEAGYSYTLNWCHDDSPTWLATRAGRLLAVPYPQDGLNDIPAIAVRHESPAQFADAIIDAFDVMRAQAAQPHGPPLVMGIALHPYICAQPHRLGHLERALKHIAQSGDPAVWLCTPGQVAAHVALGG